MAQSQREPLPFGWREHENRSLIHAETHARPVQPIAAPARVRRVVLMSADRGRDLALLHAQMTALAGVDPGAEAFARQLVFTRPGLSVTWEMHNEFVTLSWQAEAGDGETWPSGIGLELHAGLLLVMATRVDLLDSDTIPDSALSGFAPLSLCYSWIYEGQAQVATDFVPDAMGFTHFEVAGGRSGPLRCGVIVRRLLEIETYRCAALLGLPLARSLSGKVAGFEQALAAIVQQIGAHDAPIDHQQTLDKLHALSVDIGGTVEETSFRFAATQAYGDVLAERLPRLVESPIEEFTTMERYLNNRVEPALATCRAMEKRLAALSTKVQRSIELLDARISLSIQTQNQAVLDTISHTAQSQFRLQETVEGLSIIAISYYALAILGYVLEGFHDWLPLPKGPLLALAVPVLLVLVFVAVRRLRRPATQKPDGTLPR